MILSNKSPQNWLSWITRKAEKTAKDDCLKALEQELNGVKVERDARNQEKNAAQKQ